MNTSEETPRHDPAPEASSPTDYSSHSSSDHIVDPISYDSEARTTQGRVTIRVRPPVAAIGNTTNAHIMRAEKSDRGFTFVLEEKYQNERGEFTRLISESSAIGDYDDSMDKPGSSFYWLGKIII